MLLMRNDVKTFSVCSLFSGFVLLQICLLDDELEFISSPTLVKCFNFELQETAIPLSLPFYSLNFTS